MKLVKVFCTGLITIGILSGCSILSKDTIIPSDIINKAISIYEKPQSYYSEAVMRTSENNKLTDKLTIKEWSDNSGAKVKRRCEVSSDNSGEVISTNDGNQMLIYMKKDKKAMKMNADFGLGEDSNNYKQQVMKELGSISKTHDLTYKGEEVVNSFKAFHLFAKPKQKNTLLGDVNYWIDEDDWFVVKSTSESANTKTEMEYTKIEFSPKLDANLFVQDIPSDIKIQDLDNDASLKGNTIDLEQAKKIAGKAILTLKDNSVYKLKSVTVSDMTKLKRKEINQVYEKNGAEALMLTTVVFYDGKSPEADSGLRLEGEKDITVRGKKGTSMEEYIKCISWSEDTFNYSLLIEDPTLTIDDCKKLVESLQYYK